MMRVQASAFTVKAFPSYAVAKPTVVQPGLKFRGGLYNQEPFDTGKFVNPAPNRFMIKLGTMFTSYLLRGMPVLRRIPVLRSIPGIRGLHNIREIQIPKADLERLRASASSKTAAFIGPNHPEFFTDMLMDKELARLAFPDVASWAYHGFVNVNRPIQKFWLMNNVIASVPHGGGKSYAVDWALKGKAVLLHPEGTVRWTSDKVHQPFPGIADMAVEAAKKSLETSKMPVNIVPVVWKFQFVGDVSKGLHKEMEEIEERLRLPVNKHLNPGDRFFELQKNILMQQEDVFKVPEALRKEPVTDSTFYQRQAQLRDHIFSTLEAKYGKMSGDYDRQMTLFDRAIRRAEKADPAAKEDRPMTSELRRILSFTPELYDKPFFTQEHIGESLKRLKRDLFKGGIKDVIGNGMPLPAGPRIAHIRVDEPIEVTNRLITTKLSDIEFRNQLLLDLKQRLQLKLDEVNQEFAPEFAKYHYPNRFYKAA